ncbi:MAG: hypothetical protein R2749_25395 [Acidimicrobiales bacterium]
MPRRPGFISASCAPPSAAAAVAASCESAIRLASDDSVSRPAERVMSALMVPTTRLARGAASADHLAMMSLWVGSLATVRVTRWLAAVTWSRTTSPLRTSMGSTVSVTTRPNDDAEVTIRASPAGSATVQT